MSNTPLKPTISAHELALVQNDLSRLNPQDRLALYNKTCESLGLNPLTQPFGYIEFRGGKMSLYAKKDATDQLRKIHGVSVEIISREVVNDNYVVIARAKDASGRIDEDMGSVSIKGLSDEQLGNAMMKSLTKAKRRVTLSICGLGMLDETEFDTIPGTRDVTNNTASQAAGSVSPRPLGSCPEPVATTDGNIEPKQPENPESYTLKFTTKSFKQGIPLGSIKKNDLKELLISVQSHVLKTGDESPKFTEFIANAKLLLSGDE